MIDPSAEVLEFLTGQPAMVVLTGDRMYADTDLPRGYKPADGQALLLATRGGRPDYSSLVLYPSFQFRSYGPDFEACWELDQTLFDVLNDKGNCKIKFARLEAIGRPLREPDTGWPFVLTYYQIAMNSS
jgi:hypothetical protein